MSLVWRSYLLGVAIVFAPFLNFLSYSNLKQLLVDQIVSTGISLVFPMLAALIVTGCLRKFLTRKFNEDKSLLFPLICVGFYLQLHYFDLKILFIDWFGLSLLGIENRIAQALALLAICGGWLTIVVFGLKYSRYVLRCILVFIVLVVSLSVINMLPYFIESNDKHHAIQEIPGYRNIMSSLTTSGIQETASGAPKPSRNVYFIILDGMMSLENAHKLKIIDQEKAVSRLSVSGLNYVSNSLSSYDGTDLTLGSIVHMTYLGSRESDPHQIDPNLMFNKAMGNQRYRSVTKASPILIRIIEAVKGRLIWQGNWFSECYESLNWLCAYKLRYDATSFKSWLHDRYVSIEAFYKNSLIGMINVRVRKNLFGTGNLERTLIPFLDYRDSIQAMDQPIFAFIHHMAPHWPHTVTDECRKISKSFVDNYSGYTANYRCVLKEVEIFVQKLREYDSKAVIVLSGDHGYPQRSGTGLLDPLNFNEAEATAYLAQIFSAIRAPCSCFSNYGVPRGTVNLIRFAVNCAYGLNIPFEPQLHFADLPGGPFQGYSFNQLGQFVPDLSAGMENEDEVVKVCSTNL